MTHELWFTAILNKILAAPVAALLSALGLPPANAAHPIPNYFAMEILVALVLLVGAMMLRRGLSVERPGKFQHVMELVVEFTRGLNQDLIGHGSERYIALVGTLGLFVLLGNLLGVIPTLQSPTASVPVTLGCAVVAFLYYNFQGIRQHGALGYVKHLCGPMIVIAPLMLPIEIFSNFFRLLSLTARLWANMFVGPVLEGIFTGLIPIVIPVIFVGLHVFVSFLQAYVFMLLPAVYIGFAVAEEH